MEPVVEADVEAWRAWRAAWRLSCGECTKCPHREGCPKLRAMMEEPVGLAKDAYHSVAAALEVGWWPEAGLLPHQVRALSRQHR